MIFEAVQLYYVEHLTMGAIASRLGVSRPTVSRLLKEARETGLVSIRINEAHRPKKPLEQRLADLYRVRTQVVPLPAHASDAMALRTVTAAAATLLDSLMVSGTTLGVAWGSTVTELAQFLPKRPLEDVTIVQLNGAGNAHHTGIPYSGAILGHIASAYEAQMVHFPVPAFFDYAETKAAMWRERSVRGVLAVQRSADIALFGVGAFGGAIPSHVYSGGYFDPDQLAGLRSEGIVGDMCTVMVREDGTWADLAVNARATGPTPAELTRIGRRICVATGVHRAAALRGALRTGAITDLVVGQTLAEQLV
ncbi:MAG: sugar-binding domain-containing protein [Rothia sp. (in: high G+C Gram-positive bacteria)]|uniref:sugar-binding transcriptional regulator n=1 Tax=Rothia sp. (in: high G+C Gram-positive bacteria) TaxID=1885016 RepID=UPI002701842F|nr:sugar-binding domain-containing protein [Rothia sp. (in: high G+C Gram-positive bacteria)]